MKTKAAIAWLGMVAVAAGCETRALVVAEEPADGGPALGDAAAALDASADAGAADSGPDGFVPPRGNLLVPSANVAYLVDVTADDYLIYVAATSSGSSPTTYYTPYAVSLAPGSQPISLGPTSTGEPLIAVLGKAIVALSGSTYPAPAWYPSDVIAAGPATIRSTATAPSAPLGSAVVSSATPPPPASGRRSRLEIAVSADGARVAFFDDFDAVSSSASLYVAATDGSGKTLLASSVHMAGDACEPMIAWAAAYVVAAYCTASPAGDAGSDSGPSDGGTHDAAIFVASGTGVTSAPIARVTSFGGPSWAPAMTAVDVAPVFAVDSAGKTIVVSGSAGLLAYPIAGGAPVTLDDAGTVGGVPGAPSVGLFTPDGSHFVYTTQNNALRMAATSGGSAPIALSADGAFSNVIATSPDGNWVVGSTTWSYTPMPEPSPFVDLSLVSTTAASTVTALVSGDQNFLGNVVFTADSTHVVYSQGAPHAANGGVFSRALKPGAADTLLAPSLWGAVSATSGGKAIYYSGDSNHPDLTEIDLSTSAGPTKLLSEKVYTIEDQLFINPSKTTLIYLYDEPGPYNGIWTLPVP